MRKTTLNALFLLALVAFPASQAAGYAVVITTPLTTGGDGYFNCVQSDEGIVVVSGTVVYGYNERRVGDAFWSFVEDGVPAPLRAYGEGLYVNGFKVPVEPYSEDHIYVLDLEPGYLCFTFEDSQYSDNLGTLTLFAV